MLGALFGKLLSRKDADDPTQKPYRKLQVDELPIITVLKKLNYKQLLADYEARHGRSLKPLERSGPTKKKLCPGCVDVPSVKAPSSYPYANNGGKQAVMRCPHCLKTLEKAVLSHRV